MRTTKKITLSAMLAALSVALMTLGAFVEVFDLTVCAFASVIMAFVYIEIGRPYTFLVWLTVSLLSFIFFSGSVLWVEYLVVFGIYPILKAYIEKLPKWSWIILKLVYVNAVVWIIFLACELLLGIPFFGEDKLWMKIATYVLINVAFIAYDIFITVLVRFYLTRLRHRFSRFLK